jgi:hypothetical protein
MQIFLSQFYMMQMYLITNMGCYSSRFHLHGKVNLGITTNATVILVP